MKNIRNKTRWKLTYYYCIDILHISCERVTSMMHTLVKEEVDVEMLILS